MQCFIVSVGNSGDKCRFPECWRALSGTTSSQDVSRTISRQDASIKLKHARATSRDAHKTFSKTRRAAQNCHQGQRAHCAVKHNATHCVAKRARFLTGRPTGIIIFIICVSRMSGVMSHPSRKPTRALSARL